MREKTNGKAAERLDVWSASGGARKPASDSI